MGTVRYKDLCIDAASSAVLGQFWAGALGLAFTRHPDGDGHLGEIGDADKTKRIWINVVPEDKTVKHRAHLDVHTDSVASLVALGATVLEAVEDYPDRRWTVMADPEGGEFCAFVRDPSELPAYRLYELVIDAEDPQAIAHWWAGVFGVEAGGNPERGFWWIEDIPDLPFEQWVFGTVPEQKAAKNRIHWDVLVDSLDELTDAGAVIVRPQDDQIGWTVMADPEGNEFCAFVPKGA